MDENKSMVVLSESDIQKKIVVVRGVRVMLDADLAALYQVETKQLKRQVRRNISRFPADFMFELTEEETKDLRCQNDTSSQHGGNRYAPMAFTDLGVAMLSSVLTSSFNDLSEEMRSEISYINQAIADLSVKIEEHTTKPRARIGFNVDNED